MICNDKHEGNVMLLETSNLSYLLFEHKKAKTVSGEKTLIFFHGGESSNEVIRPIAPFFENVRLVLPQGPIKVKDNLYQWYNFIDGPFSVERNSLETSMKLAFRLIDGIHKKYPN